VKKWFIALLFVFACLPVVAIKAAPPQTYIHLDYEIINGYYDIGDGAYDGTAVWQCSNKIQIPKNVDKLYFSLWHTHYALFFSDEYYIGFYYDVEYVKDLTWSSGPEEKILGTYDYTTDLIHVLDVPTNATHIVLQTCRTPGTAGLSEYMNPMPIEFNEGVKPLIYYPAPADAATNITFNLMPTLMIMVVIAGLIGGLIMITKKSKR
jgi:hypothetical protein